MGKKWLILSTQVELNLFRLSTVFHFVRSKCPFWLSQHFRDGLGYDLALAGRQHFLLRDFGPLPFLVPAPAIHPHVTTLLQAQRGQSARRAG